MSNAPPTCRQYAAPGGLPLAADQPHRPAAKSKYAAVFLHSVGESPQSPLPGALSSASAVPDRQPACCQAALLSQATAICPVPTADHGAGRRPLPSPQISVQPVPPPRRQPPR